MAAYLRLCIIQLPYTYKISRDVIFADNQNPGIFAVLFSSYQPLSSIFMDDKLPVKTAKITSLENLYIYSIIIMF